MFIIDISELYNEGHLSPGTVVSYKRILHNYLTMDHVSTAWVRHMVKAVDGMNIKFRLTGVQTGSDWLTDIIKSVARSFKARREKISVLGLVRS
jgi:hypothetical protein